MSARTNYNERIAYLATVIVVIHVLRELVSGLLSVGTKQPVRDQPFALKAVA